MISCEWGCGQAEQPFGIAAVDLVADVVRQVQLLEEFKGE